MAWSNAVVSRLSAVVLVAPMLQVVCNVHDGAAAVRLLLHVLLHF